MLPKDDFLAAFKGCLTTFLSCTLIAGIVLLIVQLASCGAAEEDYYAAVAEVQELLQTSPDHLPARARALVAENDAEAIFAFVRDEIALTPSDYGHFQQATTRVRWGARGALRAGQGTFREKADLLAWLLEDAGYDAEVVGPYRDVAAESIAAAFFRDVERELSLDLTDEEAEELARRLSAADDRDWADERDGPAGLELEEQLWEEAGALTSQFLELEGSPRPRRYSLRSTGGIPLVRLTVDGQDRYLNPGFVDETFAGVDGVDELPAAPPAEGILEVRASLEVLLSASSPRWQTLVEGEWTADDLVGRQLSVGSTPAASALAMKAMRIGDIDVLTPFFLVQGGDVDAETAEALSVVGDPISADGQWIHFDQETGEVRRGNHLVSADADADPSRVAEIRAHADARRFPEIDLRVDLLDADGETVTGLGAQHFRIEDEGHPVSGRLLQNGGARPRVLFLLDTSGSIPRDFRGPPMVDFALEVAEEVLQEFPGAELGIIRVHNPAYRATLNINTTYTNNLEPLRSLGDAAIASNGGSALWASLAAASELEPTVIVFINDGANHGDDSEAVREQVSLGAPALVVGVGPIQEEVLQEMADRSGGEYFDAMETADITAPLMSFLRRTESLPYRLKYNAPSAAEAGETGEREVTVSIVGARPEGSATYEVPESPAPSPALAGLRLHLTVGDVSVTRLLAGTDDLAVAASPGEDVLADVLSTFLSPVMVFFEGDAPPPSVWLDDYTSALISQQPFVSRALRDDGDAALEEIDRGFQNLPPQAFVANGTLPGALSAEARTFARGMRVSILRQRVDMPTGLRRTSFDILPTARFATMSRAQYDGDSDGTSDFEYTLRRTTWLALIEAATFSGPRSSSTYNLLDDQPLSYSSPHRRPSAAHLFDDLPEDLAHSWGSVVADWPTHWRFVTPANPQILALWVIHKDTGELYGLLSDGTGGADTYERVQETLSKIDRLFRMYSLYTMPLNLSPAIGLLQNYFIMLAQLYAAVTMTLATMDASNLEDDIKAAIAGLICNTMQTVAFIPFKAASSFLTVINGLLAVGSDASVPMPCSLL